MLVLLAGSRIFSAIVKDEQVAARAVPFRAVGVGKGLKDLVRCQQLRWCQWGMLWLVVLGDEKEVQRDNRELVLWECD